MASQTTRTLVRFMVILACVAPRLASAALVNITVDDTDSSIVYLPAESWHSSAENCSTCLSPSPSSALHGSFHDGIHIISTNDADDKPADPDATTQNGPDKDNDADDSTPTKTANNGKSTPRALSRRFFAARLDADDEGFVDTPVTVQYNFTGSAVYLFGIQPMGVANSSNTPTAMNLTFALDNKTYPAFMHTVTASGTGFRSNISVFSIAGLLDGPHTLQVNVGVGSTFLFDYLVYTMTEESDSSGSTNASQSAAGTPIATPLSLTSPSPSIDPSVKKHNIATFGGAVGGSVGVLSVFAMCLAFSIIRRRRLAAIRDRRDRESLHTNGSEDTPHMYGPRPFVPRFFPGTVIPPDPPTYVDTMSSSTLSSPNHVSYPLLTSMAPTYLASPRSASEELSYADIPPSTPPPLEEGPSSLLPMPPPPFPVAISTPAPVLLSGGLLPPDVGISGYDPVSHGEEPVGAHTPPVDVLPVEAPLTSSRASRPPSRASMSHAGQLRDNDDASRESLLSDL